MAADEIKARSTKYNAPPRCPGWVAITCLVAFTLAVPQSAFAIDVEQVIWGFDGQAVAGRFNPVSVEFSNPTSEPFEGVVTLRRSAGGIGAGAGAPIFQQVYVGPFERSRWVQLYAWVPNEWETWRLRWPGGEYELPKPIQREREGPARVLLFDADAAIRRSGSMRQFPDHLFPPMVTATAALDAVVLGHAPRWQEPRQRAFREWLHRGGTLHLVTVDTGKSPEFPEPLAELNQPAEQFHFGRGLVVRHQRPAAQVDAAFVKTAIEPVVNPLLGQVPPAEPAAGAELDAATRELQERQGVLADDYEYVFHQSGFSDAAFTELKEMTRPQHNWPLIYLLALVYIACIFPGCYLLGLKRIDYRAVYGALLGMVALFSVAFATVGRRGYGEATAVNTLAVARGLPDGRWEVSGWSNAFVTDGDTYRIAHPGSGVLYSTGGSDEAVAGHIINGPGAELVADIPAFSSRTFVYRTRIDLPEATARVLEWNPEGEEPRIVIAVDGALATPFSKVAPRTVELMDFPGHDTTPAIAAAESWPAYAIYDDAFYSLQRGSDGQWVLPVNQGHPLETYAQTLLGQVPQRHTWFGDLGERIPAEQRFRDMQIPLVVQSLDLAHPRDLPHYTLPPDRVRLFLVAPLPPELNVQNPALGQEAGQVVYTVDVLRPDAPVDDE